MNTSERAIYRDLLDHCYESGSIPDNRVILANMAAVSLEEFDGAWSAVRRKFEPHPDQPGRLINPRVLSETTKRAAKAAAGKTGGVKSGEVRAKQLVEAPASENSEAHAGHKKKNKNTTSDEEENEQQKIKPSCAPTSGARVSEADSLLLVPKEKQPNQSDAWFNAFWLKYSLWRNRDKKRAKAAFARVVKSEATFQAVMAGIDSQDAEMMSREPTHRPHATTWLTGRRWEDSPEEGHGVAGKREPAGGAVSRAMDIFYGEER
jgi:uncharacterized protein YdaU (DUF1376 family)